VRARVPRDVPGRVGVHVREEEAGRDVPVVQGAGQQVEGRSLEVVEMCTMWLDRVV
jgi:hypothetical protein